MSIFLPTYFTEKTTDITPETLAEMHISGIVLDIDDTLVPHKDPNPDEEILKWLESLKKSGIKIILVSNNFKNRVEKFAQKLNLPCVYMGLKPLTYGIKKAIKKLQLPTESVVLIGDQIFTDILCANFIKMKSVLVRPVSKSKTYLLKFKRFFEKPIRKKIEKSPKLSLKNFLNGGEVK